MLKGNKILLLSGLLAIAFTIYIALDTFVITHVYAVVEPAANTTESISGTGESSVIDETDGETGESSEIAETESDSDQAVITDSSYSDDHIQINLTTYREYDTDIYVADITLSSPEYLKTALAQSAYGKNVTDTTSDIASEHNAILAINGDYYGVQESGYVLRNGVLYRSTAKGDQEDLVIYKDGSMEIINEQEITSEELVEKGAYNVLSFGPGLLKNGQIAVSTSDEVDKATTSNPRTALGKIDDLHYIMVVSDGRTSASEGLTLYQLAEFMQGLGVDTAYNLDGGGSSTMYMNGEVVNNPVSGSGKGHGRSGAGSSGSSERSVSDIVYIGYE